MKIPSGPSLYKHYIGVELYVNTLELSLLIIYLLIMTIVIIISISRCFWAITNKTEGVIEINPMTKIGKFKTI